MERNTAAPETVVIGQDDQNQIHVQGVLQSGLHLLDVRLWRQGAAGFAPTRSGLVLNEADAAALRQGITELIEASLGGRHAARVVWDGEEGKRLRAEIEPFGTRFLARLGFWQRGRSTWKAVDEGLVLDADLLGRVRSAIERFGAWLHASPQTDIPPTPPSKSGILDRWPASGGDWLTVDPDRIAFHPKGVRVTCTVSEDRDRHSLILRQWHREETLWLPNPEMMPLGMVDLESLLAVLLRLNEVLERGERPDPAEIACRDGASVQVEARTGDARLLCLEYRASAAHAASCLEIPLIHLSRFGRALAQGWYLLAGWLSESERAELQAHGRSGTDPAPQKPEPPVPTPAQMEEQPTGGQPLAVGLGPAEALAVPLPPLATAPVRAFAAESETPGTIIPGECQIHIDVDGFLLPRRISLPLDVAITVLPALEELDRARLVRERVDPMLLCERPDCAVYGRIGTKLHPHYAELRVWTDPTESHSISFDAAYLSDLIESMRDCLELMEVVPTVPTASTPPLSIRDPGAPARTRPIAPTTPLDGPGRSAGGTSAPEPLDAPLGQIDLGQHLVSLRLEGYTGHPILCLGWSSQSLLLDVDHLGDLLDNLRVMYYDAVRGRRGRGITVPQYPLLNVSVQNKGAQLCAVLEQEIDGEVTELVFPANQVPAFLDAAAAALSHL